MTALLAAGLSLLMIGTAFLSGIFGMAGGLILVGVLLFIFPLPTAMVLLTGVTGPLLDTLFLRSGWERRQIVATKASCQVFGHAFKLIYFGAVIDQGGSVEPWMLALAVVSSMIGTSLGKQILERLSDLQFLTWSNRIVTTIAAWYVGYGLVLLAGVA
jgi:uncharacterized membrane protein YfcA